MNLPLVLVLCLAATAGAAHAQALWTPNGLPVCVRPDCFGYRPWPAASPDGGTVILWVRAGAGSDQNLYAKKLLNDASTPPGWPASGALVVGSPERQSPAGFASDGSGGAFIVWWDWPNYRVFAQHVLWDGSIAPGWPADGRFLAQGTPQMGIPALLADGAGGMFAFWDSASTVFAQHLAGDGSRVPGWPEGGFVVRQVADAPGGSAMAAVDGAGGCFVIWSDRRNTEFTELFIQRLTRDGQLPPGWPANGIRIATGGGYNIRRGIVPDDAGGVYVGWVKIAVPKDLDDDVWATRVLGDGSIAPGWPENGLPVAVYPGYQPLSGVSADSTGGLLLTWEDARTYPPRVFLQRLRPDGTRPPGWQEGGNPISDVGGYQGFPHVAPDGQGGAFVSFDEAFFAQGYVQHVTGAGARAPGWPSTGLALVEPTMGGRQQDIQIMADGEGGAIAVWNDTRNGVASQIYAQRYTGDDITAVTMSLVRHEALPDRVALAWARGGLGPTEATIERRAVGTAAWQSLATVSFDSSGRLDYEDRSVVAGTRYAYRLRWSESDGEHTSNEIEIEVPHAIALALNGLRPNPAQGEPFVSFALPTSGRTTLELLDLGGRVVRRKDASGLGMGRHVVRLDEGERLHPGIYWVRLTHDDRTLSAKGMVLR